METRPSSFAAYSVPTAVSVAGSQAALLGRLHAEPTCRNGGVGMLLKVSTRARPASGLLFCCDMRPRTISGNEEDAVRY